MSGPPNLSLRGVVPEGLQNSAPRPLPSVLSHDSKLLFPSHLQVLLSFGPVPALGHTQRRGLHANESNRHPKISGVIMQNRVYRLIALAAGLMLASGCSGDSPAAPAAPSDLSGASLPLASAIKSDIAASGHSAQATEGKFLSWSG